MTLAESRSVKPQRIRVVTVRAGDTVDKISRRMAVADRHAERFRVLNGMQPNDRLKPGEQVKIVVE
jgi:predicted Zn-dependent protease